MVMNPTGVGMGGGMSQVPFIRPSRSWAGIKSQPRTTLSLLTWRDSVCGELSTRFGFINFPYNPVHRRKNCAVHNLYSSLADIVTTQGFLIITSAMIYL